MNIDRVVRVVTAFAEQGMSGPPPRLCGACEDVLDVSGAGVTLMTGRNSGPVCASNERAGLLEDLQFTLGEGPCQDAFATGEPVGEPDLARATNHRWPGFTPPALEAGTHGVFAFPLRAGRSHIGVLTLYQDSAGDLTADQAADSLVLAELVAQRVLSIQSGGPPGALSAGLTDASAHRAEVHQASGMVAVQLGIGVGDALACLRAYAYAAERPVAEVAADVVARRLSLRDDGPRKAGE